jgi:hypothetical protein
MKRENLAAVWFTRRPPIEILCQGATDEDGNDCGWEFNMTTTIDLPQPPAHHSARPPQRQLFQCVQNGHIPQRPR